MNVSISAINLEGNEKCCLKMSVGQEGQHPGLLIVSPEPLQKFYYTHDVSTKVSYLRGIEKCRLCNCTPTSPNQGCSPLHKTPLEVQI